MALNHVIPGTVSLGANYYALEWILEAESAPIRSAVKFCFDIDVRKNFSTFSKIIFSIDPKIFCQILGNFSKIWQHFRISLSCMLLHIENLKEIRKCWSIFENPPKSNKIFLDRSKKYFLEKLKIFSNINIDVKFHCGSNGSTLSLWRSLSSNFASKWKKLFWFHDFVLTVPTSTWFPWF